MRERGTKDTCRRLCFCFGRGLSCIRMTLRPWVSAWRILDRLKPKVSALEAVKGITEPLHGVHGGVLFTRMPLVLPEKPIWEKEYLDWQRNWHAKAGKWRDWPDWLEKGDFAAAGGESASLEETTSVDERVPPSLEQEADIKNDRKSVQRRLDVHLYLILKSKTKMAMTTRTQDGEEQVVEEEWFFPQVPHKEKETIRETCERALDTYIDTNSVQTFFIGNGPCGMLPAQHARTSSSERERGQDPAAASPAASSTSTSLGHGNEEKVFLIPCELIKGTPKLNKSVLKEGGPHSKGISDWAWIAKDEVGEYFKNTQTREYLNQLLQHQSDYYGAGTSQTY